MLLYWLIDVGRRAAAGQPLSPQERSVLRLTDSLIVGALTAALVAVLPAFVNQQPPSLSVVLSLGGAAFLQALLLAVIKLLRAGAEPLLVAPAPAPAPVASPPAASQEPPSNG